MAASVHELHGLAQLALPEYLKAMVRPQFPLRCLRPRPGYLRSAAKPEVGRARCRPGHVPSCTPWAARLMAARMRCGLPRLGTRCRLLDAGSGLARCGTVVRGHCPIEGSRGMWSCCCRLHWGKVACEKVLGPRQEMQVVQEASLSMGWAHQQGARPILVLRTLLDRVQQASAVFQMQGLGGAGTNEQRFGVLHMQRLRVAGARHRRWGRGAGRGCQH
mmetsp:Transcript_63027/g.177770  ORF Transcript_63027/g.177770 Transcript_63027/m.177770 type:complete len:218 (-) Transcript_63027:776-1429(-)